MDAQTKELVDKGIMLPLMEEFYTIQGEGYHKGHHDGKTVRYHKFDHTGFFIENLIKYMILGNNGKV